MPEEGLAVTLRITAQSHSVPLGWCPLWKALLGMESKASGLIGDPPMHLKTWKLELQLHFLCTSLGAVKSESYQQSCNSDFIVLSPSLWFRILAVILGQSYWDLVQLQQNIPEVLPKHICCRFMSCLPLDDFAMVCEFDLASFASCLFGHCVCFWEEVLTLTCSQVLSCPSFNV